VSGDVIKEFLVGLGFEVNESSLAKFNKSIATASVRVAALATTVQASAAAIGYAISGVSESFEQLGYQYRLITPAINKAIILRRELFNAYGRAGINIQRAVVESVKLNMSITKTKYALEALYKSVASKFFVFLTKQSDTFREKLYRNMPKIQQAIGIFVDSVFKALDIVYQFGERAFEILVKIYDFFVMLHKETNGWSTAILAIAAAWKVLNLSFLATPLGMILAAVAAIVTLYDDYKTFMEGGKSFFNWDKAIPVINAITEALKSLITVVKSFWTLLADVGNIFVNLFEGKFKRAFIGVKELIDDSIEHLKNFISLIKTYFGTLGTVGSAIGGFLSNAFAGPQQTPYGIPYANPVAHASNNTSQQNINATSQTTIYTQPGADADAIGKAAGESYRTYFDRVVNMGGTLSPGGALK